MIMVSPIRNQKKVRRPSQYKALSLYRRSAVPPEGWTSDALLTNNGRALYRDLVTVQRLAVADGIVKCNKFICSKYYGAVDRVLCRVLDGRELIGRQLSESVLEKELCVSCIEEVVAEIIPEIKNGLRPILQSILVSVYDKTSLLIGSNDGDRSAYLFKTSQSLANNTADICRFFGSVLISCTSDEGASLYEITSTLKKCTESILLPRVPLISRNESIKAANLGRLLSLFDSDVTSAKLIPYSGSKTLSGIKKSDINSVYNLHGSFVPQTFCNSCK